LGIFSLKKRKAMRFLVGLFMFLSVFGFAQNKMLPYTEGGDKGWVNEMDLKNLEYFVSDRDFPLGTQITTSIPYLSFDNAFLLEIKANSYANLVPVDLKVQGYLSSSGLSSSGGISNGFNISGLVCFEKGGFLCFWFPNQGYWQGYFVSCKVVLSGGYKPNTVTAITNTAKPTTGITKEVAINNIAQGINTANKNVIGQDLQSVNNLGNATNKPIFTSSLGGLGGIQGVYDPTKYTSVYSMSPISTVSADGLSLGSFYGICRSYEPDYLTVGNNAAAKVGLSHQYLFVENGLTTSSIGNGIWTNGSITGKQNLNLDGNVFLKGNLEFNTPIGNSGLSYKVGGLQRIFYHYDGNDLDSSASGLRWFSYKNDGSYNLMIANMYRNGDFEATNKLIAAGLKINGVSLFTGIVNANVGINMKASPLSLYTSNISSDGNNLNLKGNVSNTKNVSITSNNELNATLTPFTAYSANDLVNDNQTVSFVSADVVNLPAATKAVRMVNSQGATNTGVTINLNVPTMKSKEQVLIFSGVGLAFNANVVFNAPSGWFIYSGGSLAASRTFTSQQTIDAGQGCIFRVLFFTSDNTISIMRIKDN
jgi:hypothetical protein